jgi:hypothetical protein
MHIRLGGRYDKLCCDVLTLAPTLQYDSERCWSAAVPSKIGGQAARE